MEAILRAGIAKKMGLPLCQAASHKATVSPERDRLPASSSPDSQLHVLEALFWVGVVKKTEVPSPPQIPLVG